MDTVCKLIACAFGQFAAYCYFQGGLKQNVRLPQSVDSLRRLLPYNSP